MKCSKLSFASTYSSNMFCCIYAKSLNDGALRKEELLACQIIFPLNKKLDRLTNDLKCLTTKQPELKRYF